MGNLIDFLPNPLQTLELFVEFLKQLVQLSTPQFATWTIIYGPSMSPQFTEPRRRPGPMAAWRLQSLAQENRANLILHGHASSDEGLTIYDQTPSFSHGRLRHPYFRQFAHRLQTGQPLRIVTIRLALQVLEFPRLARRVRHLGSQSQLLAQVIHPAGHGARLEDDDVRSLQFQESPEVVPITGDSLETGLSRGRIQHACLTIELTQIDRENLRHSCVLLSKRVRTFFHNIRSS